MKIPMQVIKGAKFSLTAWYWLSGLQNHRWAVLEGTAGDHLHQSPSSSRVNHRRKTGCQPSALRQSTRRSLKQAAIWEGGCKMHNEVYKCYWNNVLANMVRRTASITWQSVILSNESQTAFWLDCLLQSLNEIENREYEIKESSSKCSPEFLIWKR